jgi:hypothetical protein
MVKKTQTFNLSEEIRRYFDIQSFESIIPWAEKNIDFSKDISAQRNRLDFNLYPYQKEVIQQWEDLDHIKTITVCAPEQMRKNQYLYRWFTMENDFRALSEYDCLPK